LSFTFTLSLSLSETKIAGARKKLRGEEKNRGAREEIGGDKKIAVARGKSQEEEFLIIFFNIKKQ